MRLMFSIIKHINRFHHEILTSALAWQRYSNQLGRNMGERMAILPCSPLFVLLPVRREPMSAQRTALPMRGGIADETEEPCGGIALLPSDYLVS